MPVVDATKYRYFRVLCGAQGRNRTTDTVIFSHMLYQLSYLGLLPTWALDRRS
jgi:hypothetical protein